MKTPNSKQFTAAGSSHCIAEIYDENELFKLVIFFNYSAIKSWFEKIRFFTHFLFAEIA